MIYFDAGATTLQKPETVPKAVQLAMTTMASPGRGGYREAMAAAEAVYACREQAAEMFDCQPEQVVFTFNTTHGLNLAIKTLVQPRARVVISGFEHNAVTRPLFRLGADVHVAGTKLFDPSDTLQAFAQQITPQTAAVICTHVSNVFGYVLPLAEISRLCRARGVPLIVDAAQSAGILPVSLKQTGAAFIAMPGHKSLYGPQGTGLLLCSRLPEPLLEGGTGSQSALAQMPEWLPDRAEAGTQNVAGICGLAAGMDYICQRGMGRIAREEWLLAARLGKELSGWRDVQVFCGDGGTQSGVISFQTGRRDCEETARLLAERGIAVRAGLHCAPRAHQSAGTLRDGTIRASFSAFNTPAEADRFLQTLWEILYE